MPDRKSSSLGPQMQQDKKKGLAKNHFLSDKAAAWEDFAVCCQVTAKKKARAGNSADSDEQQRAGETQSMPSFIFIPFVRAALPS